MKSKAHEYGAKEVIILVVIALLGVFFFLYKEGVITIGSQPVMNSTGMFTVSLFDVNGTELQTPTSGLNSIVNGVSDIKTASFKVDLTNAGETDFQAKIVDAYPSQLYSGFKIPQTARIIRPAGTGEWISADIDLLQFGNKSVNFSVVVEVKFSDSKQTTITKTSSLILEIDNSDHIVANQSNTTSTTDLCNAIACDDRCEGYHRLKSGSCFISGDQALCNYAQIKWFASDCGWAANQNTVCGDSVCSSNECCYVSNSSRSNECKQGVTVCTDVFKSCNIDCKEQSALIFSPAITIGG
jgi:hypothetical protein